MGGLFEELTIYNYNNVAVSFELSLSFDADFTDLFEIRGFDRQNRGSILRRVQPTPDRTDQKLVESVNELTLVYQGLDRAILESHIQRQIWHLSDHNLTTTISESPIE